MVVLISFLSGDQDFGEIRAKLMETCRSVPAHGQEAGAISNLPIVPVTYLMIVPVSRYSSISWRAQAEHG